MRYAGILGVAAVTLTCVPFTASMSVQWVAVVCGVAISTWISFIAAIFDTEAV